MIKLLFLWHVYVYIYIYIVPYSDAFLSRVIILFCKYKIFDKQTLFYPEIVLSRLVTDARVSHNSVEADLNEVRSRFHVAASKPESPAASPILKAVLRINSPSICSKMMGWGSRTGVLRLTIVTSMRGCFGGCFFSKMSWTLSEGALGSIMMSKCSGRPVLSSAISVSAALTLPSIISFENILKICSVGAFRLLPSLDK